jgi:hypothetical protein
LGLAGYLLGGNADSIATGTPDTTAQAAPSTDTTNTAPTASLPATTAAAASEPDATDVLDEPAGLFCRDLEAKGYDYAAAVRYWQHHGQPSQMDAVGNGIPCQTVYPREDIEAHWGPIPTGTIDTSHPLLHGFQDNKLRAADYGSGSMQEDLAILDSRTGMTWTSDMLLALGASYCNDWPTEYTADGEAYLGGAGRSAWSAEIAPVLGISVTQARSAIDTDIWSRYQYICE